MKILHTSDWHLGHKLYNYDRKEEQLDFLHQIANIVKEHRPDVMVVSGDIFNTATPNIEVQTMFVEELLNIHNQCDTMTIVVTAGNHDSYSRLEIDKKLWDTLQIFIIGNVYSDFEEHIIKVGNHGYVAAVPFCSERNFPQVNEDDKANRQSMFFDGLLRAVNERNVEQLPVVLMAHLSIKGSIISANNIEKDSEGNEKLVGGLEYTPLDDLGTGYDYLALGHIHHPQFVGRNCNVRYAGTPIACSFNEEYEHSVTLVEIDAHEAKPRCTAIPVKELIPVKTLPNPTDGVAIDEALELLKLHVNEQVYIRLNVLVDDNSKLTDDFIRVQNLMTELQAQCRFCLINPIRDEAKSENLQTAEFSIDEIKEMSAEKVLDIVQYFAELNENQQNMLKSIIDEVNDRFKNL